MDAWLMLRIVNLQHTDAVDLLNVVIRLQNQGRGTRLLSGDSLQSAHIEFYGLQEPDRTGRIYLATSQ